MSTSIAPSSLNQLTMVSNIKNLNSNLDFIQKQYNISIDVWNIILNHLFKNKLNSSIDWITNPKIHRILSGVCVAVEFIETMVDT